jgi:hypothetical protein
MGLLCGLMAAIFLFPVHKISKSARELKRLSQKRPLENFMNKSRTACSVDVMDCDVHSSCWPPCSGLLNSGPLWSQLLCYHDPLSPEPTRLLIPRDNDYCLNRQRLA